MNLGNNISDDCWDQIATPSSAMLYDLISAGVWNQLSLELSNTVSSATFLLTHEAIKFNSI